METAVFLNGFEIYKPFLDIVPVGVSILANNGTILFANKVELQMLGYQELEYVNHNIEVFHKNRTSVCAIFNCLQHHKSFFNQEAQLVCKDGSLRDVLISSAVNFPNRSLEGTICFTRDISYLKKSETYLKFLNHASDELSSMQDMAEALHKITELIVPAFADWVVINDLREDGFAHLLKMAHVDAQKVEWAEQYRNAHPIDLQDPQIGSVGWAMRTGQSLLITDITPDIIESGAKDEEQRELLKELSIQSVMIIPMQVNGRVTGVVSFMSCHPANKYDEQAFSFAKNLTTRIAVTIENVKLFAKVKLDIEQRIEIDKKKDEFISIASHELKTPITTLKAYTQMVQMILQNNSETEDMLHKMDKQIDRLYKLVEEMLDISRIENGQLMFEFEEFDFNELVTEIADEMQRISNSHTIKLELKPCEKIKGDRNRIGQVITNFISNAIKYSPGANSIIVASECFNNTVRLSVTDFGIGVPEEQHSKIFDRFFRCNNNPAIPGLGLGLYICSQIIRRHNGRIYFKSSEGQGSTFHFEISAYTPHFST